MLTTRHVLTATLAAATLAAGAAGPASASSVAAPTVLTAPATSPVDIAGGRPQLMQGDRLRRGDRLVRRLVRLDSGERSARFTLTCPGATRLQGLGLFEGSRLGFRLQSRSTYVGRRSVGVIATTRRGAASASAVRGSFFALCRPPRD